VALQLKVKEIFLTSSQSIAQFYRQLAGLENQAHGPRLGTQRTKAPFVRLKKLSRV
jgi:hypothetical protein